MYQIAYISGGCIEWRKKKLLAWTREMKKKVHINGTKRNTARAFVHVRDYNILELSNNENVKLKKHLR